MSTDIDTRITPALHPDNVREIEGYAEGDVAAVLAPTMTAFDEAYRGIGKVHDAREAAKKNPVWNESMQIIATDDMAQKQLGRIAKGFDSVRANLTKGIEHIEKELSSPVESRASVTLAAEVRAHAKGLAPGERMNLVRQAIDGGDHITATAILGAPAYLSGLDANMQATLLRTYHEKHNPVQATRLKVMTGARELIEKRAGLVFTELEKAVGVPPHKARQLREAKTNSEKTFVLRDA